MNNIVLFLPLILFIVYSTINKRLKSELLKESIDFSKYFPTIDALKHIKTKNGKANTKLQTLTYLSISITAAFLVSFAFSFINHDQQKKQLINLMNDNILNYEGIVIDKYQQNSSELGDKLKIQSINGGVSKISIINQPEFYSEVDSGDYVIKSSSQKYILLIRESDTLRYRKN